ncbi:MAG TPA: hypothetical protein VLX28_04515, partial [Thermoanaerobaculia bacterium]|nr:hypothetical protein [Thermoanaerobaculia bacterium]
SQELGGQALFSQGALFPAWSRGRPPLQENQDMKKQLKKIVLAKETLRSLDGPEIAQAQGAGALPNTQFNSCRCPTLSCQHPGFC